MPKSNILPNKFTYAAILSSCLILFSTALISSCKSPPSTTAANTPPSPPPEISPSTPIPPSPTQITITPDPTPIPSITPFPTATLLNTLYDGFNDACISTYKWYPQAFGPLIPDPTPIVRDFCFDFSYPDAVRHLAETNTHLVLNLTEEGLGGLISLWPSCEVREVQLVISDYSFLGISGSWLGLAVPHPQTDQPPLSIWISSKESLGISSTKVLHTRRWIGDQTTQTVDVLSNFLPEDMPIILGIRFTGEFVSISAGNLPESKVIEIPAMGFPPYFVVSYSVLRGSELSFKIDEVRVIPRAYTSKCDLPIVTPSP